ncbi:MAG: hypothetical protein V4649_18335 [Bacteroidota bacterium]
MRPRKNTKGKVAGAKFEITEAQEGNDLKAAKAETLKQLEEAEKNKQEWYDKEMEKNMKK